MHRSLELAGGAAVAAAALLVAVAAADAARDRLRAIVQEQCLPSWQRQHRADPCESVQVGAADANLPGYAILHDRKGGAHFLLIATDLISGIESPQLLRPDAPDFFAASWQARGVLAAYLGHPVPRQAVGLALNSIRARSQDQLHIHIECLGRQIYSALSQQAPHIHERWSEVALAGWKYQALRISGENLGARNPLKLLAAGMPAELVRAGRFTVLVAGMQYADGPGFAVLASDSAPGAELLLDSACEVGAPGDGS